jgi:hypothetical protein
MEWELIIGFVIGAAWTAVVFLAGGSVGWYLRGKEDSEYFDD